MGERNGKRIITDTQSAEEFCESILFYDISESELSTTKKNEFEEAVKNILAQEKLICDLNNENAGTFSSQRNRIKKYRAKQDREDLRKQIAESCLNNKRVEEREITLENGGMLPKSVLKYNKQFYLVIGLPAAGKSTLSGLLADKTGSVYLDADIVKRKIPEFKTDTRGAALVHEESTYILRPCDLYKAPDYNILVNCLQYGMNIVYNTIGGDYSDVKEFIDVIKEKEYELHLLLVELDRFKSVQRAYRRYKADGRYISLPLIFDVHSNNPTISFYKCVVNNNVNSYAHIDNDVELGKNKKIITNRFKDPAIINYISRGAK